MVVNGVNQEPITILAVKQVKKKLAVYRGKNLKTFNRYTLKMLSVKNMTVFTRLNAPAFNFFSGFERGVYSRTAFYEGEIKFISRKQ